MMKSFVLASALSFALVGAALAQPGNNGGGNGGCGVGQQTNGCGGVLNPPQTPSNPQFGGAFQGNVAIGSWSGTKSGTFAKNFQSGVGTGYAQTESFGNAGSELQGGTQLPFRANALANTGSGSVAGSSVNNGNGKVYNSTGGFGKAAAGLGAAGSFGISR